MLSKLLSKRLVPSRLHGLHESELPFVSRIEFIRAKLSNFSAHVSAVWPAFCCGWWLFSGCRAHTMDGWGTVQDAVTARPSSRFPRLAHPPTVTPPLPPPPPLSPPHLHTPAAAAATLPAAAGDGTGVGDLVYMSRKIRKFRIFLLMYARGRYFGVSSERARCGRCGRPGVGSGSLSRPPPRRCPHQAPVTDQ